MSGLSSAHATVVGDAFKAGFQNFVDQSATLTAVNGTPGAGQFRSSITGRAPIPDIANDLRASFGVERLQAQGIVQLQNEFGASGEPVYAALNDDRGLIRYVGSWGFASSLNYGGNIVVCSGIDSYIEVVFYGTGLNILAANGSAAYDARSTVDGGTESGNLFVGSAQSGILLTGRNSAPNEVIPATSSFLSLGIHTVRIRNNWVSGFNMNGLEIVTTPWATANTNSTTTVTLTNLTGIPATLSAGVPVYGPGIAAGTTVVSLVGSTLTISLAATATATGVALTFGSLGISTGTAYIQGQKVLNSVADSIAYSTGITGAKGGRVVRYLNADGTVGQAVTLVDTNINMLTNATHTNEEVVRTYNWREFGAGRNPTGSPSPRDDFSTDITSARAAAFTLDDGTTALVGNSVSSTSSYYTDGLRGNTTSDYITLTFVGTGLDADMISFGGVGNVVSIDGGANNAVVAQTKTSIVKIVSGLPYGTHTAKFTRGGAGVAMDFKSFIVYQPKKPSIPATAVELCDYNVMGDYAQLSSLTGLADKEKISTGVLRKSSCREGAYVGAGWNILISTNNTTGVNTYNAVAGEYVEYTFFGTGIEYRGNIFNAIMSYTFSIDGSTNLSGYSTSLVFGSTGITFVAATGVLSGTPAAYSNVSVKISGLTLGMHKIKIAYNSGNNLQIDALDIITPIHAVKSNLYADLQNTLPVGSCSLTDSRKTTPLNGDRPSQKAWAQAVGISNSPTTTNTSLVPCPDMSLTIKTNGSAIKIDLSLNVIFSTGAELGWILYVDGVSVAPMRSVAPITTGYFMYSESLITPVSPGVHKVDLYWASGGGQTLTLRGGQRILTVQEL